MSENVDTLNVLSSPDSRVAKQYVRMTQREHVLNRPDTYVGSVDLGEAKLWLVDEGSNRMTERKVTWAPALMKIFDEVLVNAADNKQRDPNMNTLKVEVDPEEGLIRIWNNGKGIPVAKHPVEKMYVPTLTFGYLLTSSNFDDTQKKTTGGRNGLGAKLANIFSLEFNVETVDSERKLKFSQTWFDNMERCDPPRVTKVSSSRQDYTCITFKPDMKRFGMSRLDEDTVEVMKRRVWDIAGTSGKGLKVFWNGDRVPVSDFKAYVESFFPEEDEMRKKITFMTSGNPGETRPRWEVAVMPSKSGEFGQVSFVNSICTYRGGTHVKYIRDQLVAGIHKYLARRHKKDAPNVTDTMIRNNLHIVVNALIENPQFTSQTKETLTKRVRDFGSKCEIDDKFISSVCRSGIMDNILDLCKAKKTRELKKRDGRKQVNLTGIPKLEDANDAGTRNARHCTLILTEGESAKALAMSGLSVVGRDRYGVFPLKGKLLNVRDATHSKIMKNEEISNLIKILGLKTGVKYKDVNSLRYGHVMIMADQDHDGSHIKGLVINLFHTFWPSLLEIPGFLREFITPIVTCSKGKKTETFYTQQEYENWRAEMNGASGWKVKYYKGLGTSTAADAKRYFSNLERLQIDFVYKGSDDDRAIDIAFNRKQVEKRKEWLTGYTDGTFLDMNVDQISFRDFIDKELILFSRASNQRAIPSVVDGFKPGQRKILFACFKRNLTSEIKVAQLAGYVAEHSAYHHGEASLNGTIVNLAQNYVGANNINLLCPSGQFGTRHQGGRDSASPRYIFTHLMPIARALFPADDDPLLNYLNDDGQSVEPEWYIPVLPNVLINGAAGIGTGWSTNVPNHNPADLIANIRRMLRGEQPLSMLPWYNGFTGEITQKGNAEAYTVRGVVEQLDATHVEIRELPLQTWTADYKKTLEEKYLIPGKISGFRENHSDNSVSFVVSMTAEQMATALKAGLQKFFGLVGSLSATNLVLHDAQGHLRKYRNTAEMLQEFYDLRLGFYAKRRQHKAGVCRQELDKLRNRVRFILAVVNEELIIRNVPKKDILNELVAQGYTPFPRKQDRSEEVDESSDEEETIRSGDYDYLLSMPLWSLTLEKVQELLRQKKEKEKELEKIMKSTPESLWEEDLQKLEDALAEHYQAVEDELRAEQKIRARNRKKQKKAKKGKKKSNPWSESDEEDVDMFSDEDDEDDVPRKGKKGRKKKTVSQKSRLKATTSNLGMPVDLSLEPLSLLATTTSAARKTSAKRASRAKAAASDESSDVTAKKTTRTKASGGSKKAAPPKKTSRTKKKKKSSRIDPDSEAELEALMNDITLNDDEDDEYSVSDAEPRETIASTRPRRSTARQTRFLDMLDDSDFLDEEDDEDSPFLGEDDDDDGEEEFVPETLPPKRTSRGKAATTRRAAAPKRTTKVIEESESEDDSAGPDPTQGLSLAERIALRQKASTSSAKSTATGRKRPSPEKALAKGKRPRTAASSSKAKVAAAAKPPAKGGRRQLTRVGQTDSEDEEFDLDLSSEDIQPVTRPRRTVRRTAKAISYAEFDSSEDSDDSYFEEDDDDDYSDY